MRGFFSVIFSRLTLSLLLIAAYLSAIIFLCFYIPSLLSFGAAAVGVYLLSAVVSLSLLNNDEPPEYKCAWLCFIAAVPVVGAVMRVVFTHRRQPDKKTLHFKGNYLPPAVPYADFCYFSDGAQYFERLFYEIDRAKSKVYLEYFIIGEGEIYSRLHACLVRALERGVEVKIIADGMGSALRLPRKKLKKLKALGAKCIVFHRISPLPISRLNFRDHRKIAAIDGRIAFSGGVNVADEYAGITAPHGYWKDTGFCVEGNAAKIFEELFLSIWSGSRQLYSSGEERDSLLQGGKTYADCAQRVQYMTPVYDSPPAQSGLCEDLICSAIYSARARVWAFTPYLCLDERLKRAFCFAAQSGVDVKIIIPHVPDKKLTFALTKIYATELLPSGVGIYEYTPGFMHAKCLICDEKCLLGSYNLDFRSMSLNYECGGLFEGEITQSVVADFLSCLALCEKMTTRAKNAFSALLKLFAPLA